MNHPDRFYILLEWAKQIDFDTGDEWTTEPDFTNEGSEPHIVIFNMMVKWTSYDDLTLGRSEAIVGSNPYNGFFYFFTMLEYMQV